MSVRVATHCWLLKRMFLPRVLENEGTKNPLEDGLLRNGSHDGNVSLKQADVALMFNVEGLGCGGEMSRCRFEVIYYGDR